MRIERLLAVSLSIMSVTQWFCGCATYPQPTPVPVVVQPVISPPSWSPEKEERLKRAQADLEDVKRANSELAAKMERAQTGFVSEDEIKALTAERDRLRQKRDYLLGEVKALMDEKTGIGGPYTGNRK